MSLCSEKGTISTSNLLLRDLWQRKPGTRRVDHTNCIIVSVKVSIQTVIWLGFFTSPHLHLAGCVQDKTTLIRSSPKRIPFRASGAVYRGVCLIKQLNGETPSWRWGIWFPFNVLRQIAFPSNNHNPFHSACQATKSGKGFDWPVKFNAPLHKQTLSFEKSLSTSLQNSFTLVAKYFSLWIYLHTW